MCVLGRFRFFRGKIGNYWVKKRFFRGFFGCFCTFFSPIWQFLGEFSEIRVGFLGVLSKKMGRNRKKVADFLKLVMGI